MSLGRKQVFVKPCAKQHALCVDPRDVFFRNCRTFQTFNQEKRARRWFPHLPRNTFRRCQKHSMASQQEPSERPDCTTREENPSFTLRTALSINPIVSGRRGGGTCHASNSFRRKLEKIICVDCSLVFDLEDGIVADASWCLV